MKALLRYFLFLCLLIGNTIPLASLAGNGGAAKVNRIHSPSEIAIHPAAPAHGCATEHLKFLAFEEIEEDFETNHQKSPELANIDMRMLLSILMLNPVADLEVHKFPLEDTANCGPVQRRHLVLCTFLI